MLGSRPIKSKCVEPTKLQFPLDSLTKGLARRKAKEDKMLKSNLQFFAEVDPEEEFDLDSFEKEFEEKWEEPEEEVEEETPEQEEEEEEETPEEEEESEPEQQEEEPQFQNEKQNRAFADMRRQLEEAKKYQGFLNQIAEQNGMTPDDIMKQYEERQIENQAKETGVPVEFMKRLNSLEQENEISKQREFETRFNTEVSQVVEKHGLKQEDVDKVIDYMAENRLDPRVTPVKFEDAYFLANKDTILAKEREQANQEYLSNKKKRQNTSAVPSGTSDSPNTEAADIEADVLAYLKEQGDI